MLSGIKTISPDGIGSIDSFIGDRFKVNVENRVKDWRMAEHFVELYEQDKHDSWFWVGEQIGKWLDAAAYSAVIAEDRELEDKVHEIIGRLKASQREDGWLSISRRANPVRGMQLYEWYYVMHGLIVCYEILHSEVALRAYPKNRGCTMLGSIHTG